MGSMSWVHWLIVLLVVVLVFGTKHLKSAGRDLGEAVKGFKKGMSDDDKSVDSPPAAQLPDQTRADGSRDASDQVRRDDQHTPR